MNEPDRDRRATRQLVADHLTGAAITAAGDRADGHRADGDGADGHRADGHGADGHRADRDRAETSPADSITLALGVPGITLGPAGELTACGRPCRPQQRRLTDLLTAGGEGGLYFADRPALEAAQRSGYDPVLYHAFRDFLPPREISGGHCLPAGAPGYDLAEGGGYQFADLIVYQPGTLPGGELFRSTGHWNLPWQLEIFQTLAGRILMLVGGRDGDGQPFLYEQACGPGEVIAVPFGAWHVSYVLEGPAAVFNVFTDLSELAGERDTGREILGQGPAKYRRAEPIAVTAVRQGAGHALVSSPAAGGCGPLSKPPGADWLRQFLPPGESLADLHLYASPSRLTGLQHEALEAHRPARPTRL
jgi:hypothetical protein